MSEIKFFSLKVLVLCILLFKDAYLLINLFLNVNVSGKINLYIFFFNDLIFS